MTAEQFRAIAYAAAAGQASLNEWELNRYTRPEQLKRIRERATHAADLALEAARADGVVQ